MDLKEKLRSDLAEAMRDNDSEKRDTLRLLLAAIKQVEVDGRVDLDDQGVMAVLIKQAKQRRESIDEYEKADRDELAAREGLELEIIESYLPTMMSREEVRAIAVQVAQELGVTDIKGMGQVMGKLINQLKGKADGRVINEVVRDVLQSGQSN